MKQKSKIKYHRRLPVKTMSVMIAVVSVIAASLAFRATRDLTKGTDNNADKKDSVESVKAFMKVYKVLMSPRCMNCHPAGDAPLQGDDSHIHTMNVVRGPDGNGNVCSQMFQLSSADECTGLAYTSGKSEMAITTGGYEDGFPGKDSTSAGTADYELQS